MINLLIKLNSTVLGLVTITVAIAIVYWVAKLLRIGMLKLKAYNDKYYELDLDDYVGSYVVAIVTLALLGVTIYGAGELGTTIQQWLLGNLK